MGRNFFYTSLGKCLLNTIFSWKSFELKLPYHNTILMIYLIIAQIILLEYFFQTKYEIDLFKFVNNFFFSDNKETKLHYL